MARKVEWKLRPVPLADVSVEGGLWGRRLDVNRTVTLPATYRQSKETGRIDAFRLEWQPGMPNRPHLFWDSDMAKWIEAAAYSLTTHPDDELEGLVDGVIDLIAAAQQPDGYLNTHFTSTPEQRWTNLRDAHELYCAGHLIEAAVAYHQATGKRKLLDVLCRYADLIGSVFGPGEGQKRGYPGHEEIELALVKLRRATGQERYLKLSKFFVDERGRQPRHFEAEARARNEEPKPEHDYWQAHLPVRAQTSAEGHAVRAMYLYCAMADLAAETDDAELLAACKRLWQSVAERRMYVTGGIGSSGYGERFTFDYDLPDETAYAETCAAIGLVFWAHRMLHITGHGRYADVMERALYNGVLSGVSLDGTRFFYANPLASHPAADRFRPGRIRWARQDWFDCACCPANLARLLASFPQYVYSRGKGEPYVHLYATSQASVELNGQRVRLSQQTGYPWDGAVSLTVEPPSPLEFVLALRLPGWCRAPEVRLNGEPLDVDGLLSDGYAHIERRWSAGDEVQLDLPMPVERIRAHPKVRQAAGRVALQRGPIVYCLEEVDNGPDLNAIALPAEAELHVRHDPDLLGGVTTITGRAARLTGAPRSGELYAPVAPTSEPCQVRAVPYCTWANREPGEMLVWIREP
ncbi:MAG: glycoside hydrolase family 127 protein [Planctomycetota bacterium]